ncbi:hypothetical protein HaloA020_36540 [Halomonas sp. A020]|nr:hypothetical protein HaloA020_36540 [Halomonas sp. A020]
MRGVINTRADGDRLAFGDGARGAQRDGGSVVVIADGDHGGGVTVESFVVAACGALDAQVQRVGALLVDIVSTALEGHAAGGLAHGDGDLLAVAERNDQRAALRGVINTRADGDRLAFGDGARGAQRDGGSVGVIVDGDRGGGATVEGFVVAAFGALDAQVQRVGALLVNIVSTTLEGHAAGGLAHGDGDLLAVAERNDQRAALRGVINTRADGDRLAFGDGFRNGQCNGGDVIIIANNHIGFRGGIDSVISASRGRINANRN